MKRTPSGIKGLDEMLEGGYPEGDNILVTGPPGSAKSTFALQFLVNGITEYGDPSLFIDVGERISKLSAHVHRFGWDLNKLTREGKLLILAPQLKPEEGDDPLSWLESKEIKSAIKEFKPKRASIDSLTLLLHYTREHGGYRRGVQKIMDTFNPGCTTLFVSELSHVFTDKREYRSEEFIADGIINLHYMREINVFDRSFSILKMRGTNHSRKITRFAIEDGKGIVVYTESLVPGEIFD